MAYGVSKLSPSFRFMARRFSLSAGTETMIIGLVYYTSAHKAKFFHRSGITGNDIFRQVRKKQRPPRQPLFFIGKYGLT